MTGSVAALWPLRRAGLAVLASVLVAYLGLHHGAIRSPDAELSFRTSVSLAERGSFGVEEDLPWPGFGLATGLDGQRFSVFGPLQPLVSVPWVRLADAWTDGGDRSRLREPPYASHYADEQSAAYMRGQPTSDLKPHRLRAVVSLFNVPVTLATVWALAWSLFPLVRRRETAWATALLFGLGTLAWPYAGTFFSEPLATLLSVLSFGAVLRSRNTGSAVLAVAAGVLLGLATAAHLTAVLFAPFWLWILARQASANRGDDAVSRRALVSWCGGLLTVLALLALFNVARFGDPFQTGRSVDMEVARSFAYGEFVPPWRGLVGLLTASGKGLAWYSPLVLLGLLCWRTMRRRWPVVADAIAVAVLFRLVFIASRSDWHGGFALGPRLMVQVLPFALVPIGLWLDEQVQPSIGLRRWWLAAGAGAAAAAQQAWFCLGEPFAWLHLVAGAYAKQGLAPFADDLIYMDWQFSPLLHLDRGPAGPWWHPGPYAGTEPVQTFVLVAAVLLVAGWFVVYRPRTGGTAS